MTSDRVLAGRVIELNGARYYAESAVIDAMASCYRHARVQVAAACDVILDPRGALLGYVRQAAAVSESPDGSPTSATTALPSPKSGSGCGGSR